MRFDEFLQQTVYNKNEMKKILKRVQIKKGCDALGNEITQSNYLTIHHIFKIVYGGDYTIDNCILLTLKFHQYLHYLEQTDLKEYLKVNRQLLEVVKETNLTDERAKQIVKKRGK